MSPYKLRPVSGPELDMVQAEACRDASKKNKDQQERERTTRGISIKEAEKEFAVQYAVTTADMCNWLLIKAVKVANRKIIPESLPVVIAEFNEKRTKPNQLSRIKIQCLRTSFRMI